MPFRPFGLTAVDRSPRSFLAAFLARHFIPQYAQERNCTARDLSRATADLFLKHTWPGNIRELQNLLRRAALNSKKEIIELQDIPFEFCGQTVVANVKLGHFRTPGLYPPAG